MLGQKVSTTSTRTQESNKQTGNLLRKITAGVPENQKNMKSCKDLAPKGHLKARGIPVSNKTIKRPGRTDELSGDWKSASIFIYAYS